MEHFVDFKQWCPLCRNAGTDENKEPCEECVTYPVNDDSRKPIRFEEKPNDYKKRRD